MLEATSTSALVSINTAGKALGVAGAFAAGSEPVIEYLLQRARTFAFSTAAPPSVAAALAASLDIIEAEPQRRHELLRLSLLLRSRLRQAGIDVVPAASHILAVILGENERAVAVAEALQQDGFDVRAIRPPTVPVGTARLRIAVNINLAQQDLDRFVSALKAQAFKAKVEMPVCAASS